MDVNSTLMMESEGGKQGIDRPVAVDAAIAPLLDWLAEKLAVRVA